MAEQLDPSLDPYSVLGVAPRATQGEINHAYRQLLQRHHPDTRRSQDAAPAEDATAALQRILTAYALLRDPALRADFDLKEACTRPRRDPVSRFPSAPIRALDDPISSEPDVPLRVGPVRWHHEQPPR